ncbi:MAG: HutD family protein [Alphaproteobacteria bacterium]
MTRILRAADRRRIPWKNGGGEAEDIASFPADSSWDRMDWRVGRAWIAASGPFSIFPGIDRTFLVASGDGVTLSPDRMPPARLDPSSPPFAFPGDVATGCDLTGGPTVAFNVMSTRGRWSHRVQRRRWAGSLTVPTDAAFAVMLQGSARVGDASLSEGDAIAVDGAVTLEADGEAAAALVFLAAIR